MIDKGIISSFETDIVDRNNDCSMARVLPMSSQNMPTRPLVISWHLRGRMGALKVGDAVFFALADDLSGIILERADGEWTGVIPGDVVVTGNQLTEGSTSINQSLTVVETVTADDVTTSAVASQNQHVHGNGNQGNDTTAPKG